MPTSEHKSEGFGTLDHYIAEWLKSDHRSSAHTRQAYRCDLAQFLQRCAAPFDRVSINDLKDYTSMLRGLQGGGRMAQRTVARKIATLRSFYRFLNRENITALNLDQIEMSKVKPSIDHDNLLTVEEVKAIISAANDDTHRLFVRLLYLTAARVSEALALRWRDLMPLDDGGQAHIVGKGGKHRKVFLTAALWIDLMSARGESAGNELIFPAINRRQAIYIVRKLARSAEIEKTVSPHSFRHAHLSHALERGSTLAELRDQAGHANIVTTSLYVHANSKRASAKLLDVE